MYKHSIFIYCLQIFQLWIYQFIHLLVDGPVNFFPSRCFYHYFDHFFSPQNLSVCPEDESIIMSSFVNTMTSLSVKQGNKSFKLKCIFLMLGFQILLLWRGLNSFYSVILLWSIFNLFSFVCCEAKISKMDVW